MTPRRRPALFLFALLLSLTAASFNAIAATPRPVTLTTRDGRTIDGAATLDGDALTVATPAGSTSFKLADIATANFHDNAAPTGNADTSAGGLKAEYFDDQDLHKLKLVRYDPAIDFRWGIGPPDASVAADFATRWAGQLEPKYSETYTFYTHANDGVRLWVDGRLIIDEWFDRPPYDQKGTIALEAGHKVDLRMEYHNQMAEASAQLAWSSVSQVKQVVPASRLSPPAASTDAWRVTLNAPPPAHWLLAPPELQLQATLTATTQPAAQRVDFYSGGTRIASATTQPFRVPWPHVPAGHHRLTAKAVDASGVIHASPPVVVDVAANGSGTLPAPWGALRLGTAERADHCTYSGGLFSLRAGGGELRAASDSGYFVGQPLEGDGQITARIGDLVASEQSPAPVAGVMIRESLAGDARSVALLVGKEGAEYLRRWETGSWVAADDLPRNAPCYLRLVRSGDNVKAFVSDTGSNWQLIRSDSLTMSHSAYVGLIASSRSDDGLCTVTADHVQVTAGEVPMDASVAGVRTVGGSFLAGPVRRADDKSIVLSHRGRDLKLSPDAVARITLHPLPIELLAQVGPNRPGVLLTSGDFIDGDLKAFHGNHVTIDSVVFGEKSFNTNEVLAVLLRDVVETPHTPKVRTRDGSVYAPRTVSIKDGRLQLDDDTAGTLLLPLDELTEIAE